MVPAKVGPDLIIEPAGVSTGILAPVADEDVRHNGPILAEIARAGGEKRFDTGIRIRT
jgi:hypothetical protein